MISRKTRKNLKLIFFGFLVDVIDEFHEASLLANRLIHNKKLGY